MGCVEKGDKLRILLRYRPGFRSSRSGDADKEKERTAITTYDDRVWTLERGEGGRSGKQQ